MEVIVGIAEMRVSDDPDIVLAAYSLGSCMGVALWDSFVKVGGLLHFMLPNSRVALDKAHTNPFMFADTGIPSLLLSCFGLGAERDNMAAWLVGGTQLLDSGDFLDIGRRNHAVAREILVRNRVEIAGEDVGGSVNRTLKLEVGTGKVWVVSGEREVRTL